MFPIVVTAGVFIIFIVSAYIFICRRNFEKLSSAPYLNPSIDHDANRSTRVVVVGAGVAGIAAAKTFLRYGYENVVLLERSSELGGVWNSGQYAGAGIQTAYWIYAYPDFPWPRDLTVASESEGGGTTSSPGRAAVQEYLRRYAEEHGVLDRIRYGCEVQTATRDDANDSWTVETVVVGGGCGTGTGTLVADVLIVAIGNNDASNPIVPPLPDRHLYRGRTMHSSEVGDGAVLRGTGRIAVVGGSKSAFDVGQLFPDRTTLIMRTPHYWFPMWALCVPFYDRISNFMLRGYRPDRRDRSWLVRFLDEVSVPLFLAVGTNRPTYPHRSFLDDFMSGGGANVCTTAAQYANAKRWHLKTSSPVAYTPDGLRLENGDIAVADAIVWGTGFDPTSFFRKMFPGVDLLRRDSSDDEEDDGLYLHKYVVHPSLPRCYFVGCRDLSLATLCNASLQSLWAVHCEAGVVTLPDVEEMRKSLDERRRDSRARLPRSRRRAYVDHVLRRPRCDVGYGADLVEDCGLGDRLPGFWCHPANAWTATSGFRAVLAMPIERAQGEDSERVSSEKVPLALV